MTLEEKIKRIIDSVHNRFKDDKDIMNILNTEAIITMTMKRGKFVLDNIKFSNHGSLLLTSLGIYYFPVYNGPKKILIANTWEDYYS